LLEVEWVKGEFLHRIFFLRQRTRSTVAPAVVLATGRFGVLRRCIYGLLLVTLEQIVDLLTI
jgi:hypothetical protein